VELCGPSNRKVDAEIKFYSSSSPEPILARTIESIVLPCSQSRWSDLWTEMSGDRQIQNTYDASTECELIFHCEELGRFALRACRESSPVRWIVKQENNGYFLRLALLDDQTETSLAHYPFRSPAESSPMSADPITGFRVSEAGGLFAAITEKYRTAIVVPPAIHSLKWLSAVVAIPQATPSEAALDQHIRALELWTTGRAVGNPFAAERKAAAVSALLQEIVRVLCGKEWLHFEQEYSRGAIAITDLKNFVSPAKHNPIAREIILLQQQRKESTPNEIAESLYELICSFLDLPAFSGGPNHGANRQEWVTEFVYRLFSAPASARSWANQDLPVVFGYLLKNPILCRIGRFAALLSRAEDVNSAEPKAVTL
jgi:hypothetical protein